MYSQEPKPPVRVVPFFLMDRLCFTGPEVHRIQTAPLLSFACLLLDKTARLEGSWTQEDVRLAWVGTTLLSLRHSSEVRTGQLA